MYNPVVHHEIPGTDMKVPGSLKRIGQFIDYNFKIEPYSMSYNPPELKLQKLTNIVGQLSPFLPLMQQQGINLNFTSLIKMYSEYSNLPELLEILEVADPMQSQSMSMERPVQNATTTRNYVRENRSGGNSKQATNDIINKMFQGNQGS